MRKLLNHLIVILAAGSCPILIGQNAKAPKKASKAGTEFEFEGSSIKGERGSSMGSILGQASPDQDYDFVTIRGNWQREMIKSADSLDTQVSSLNIEND